MSKETTDASEKEVKRMMMELLYDEAYVDVSEEIKQPPVAISCGTYTHTDFEGNQTEYYIPIGTYGNFSFIHAEAKVGKSLCSSLIISAYMGGKNKYTGLLKGHRKGKKIVHFDTEQSTFHAQTVFRRPLVMNGFDQDANYYTYALREMSPRERVDFIDYVLSDKLDGKDIGLVIIDGIADLQMDANNLTECSETIQKLLTWTAEYECHIITVIHSNKGTKVPTGHLGNFLSRKCETQMVLERNSINQGWTTVECKRGRNKNFETFSFCLNDMSLPEFIDHSYDF